MNNMSFTSPFPQGLNISINPFSQWHHQMETFSALLAICARNSPVPGEFPGKSQWRGAFFFFFICAWINGGLRRHRTHNDVIVIPPVISAVLAEMIDLGYLQIERELRMNALLWSREVITLEQVAARVLLYLMSGTMYTVHVLMWFGTIHISPGTPRQLYQDVCMLNCPPVYGSWYMEKLIM